MIKYIGSKRTLVPRDRRGSCSDVAGARSVIDLFSGTSRVGHALKAAGCQVFANDHNAYAAALAPLLRAGRRRGRAATTPGGW